MLHNFVFPQLAGGAEDEAVEGEGGAEGTHDMVFECVAGDCLGRDSVG